MRKLVFFIIALFLAFIFLSDVSHAAKVPPHVASFWHKVKDKIVQCELCPRKCVIADGQRGLCTVRVNKDGVLYTLGYGNPVAVHIDPIEKKPFFNVLPGENAFSLAVAGCNMRCLFCQNWTISQSRPDEVTSYSMAPKDIVESAIKSKCPFIVYTYTEPTVFYEYICEGKGSNDSMFCCGTNVVFRKKALSEVGGLDESTITEDFATSVKLHTNGWKSLYYNHVYAFGMGPENLTGYFKQQFRWAIGTISVLKKIIWQFVTRPFSLTFAQWWEYFLSSSYYLVGFAFFFLMIC